MSTVKPNILIFEAHSDDAVIGMGGTILKFKEEFNFILVTMTKGETAYTTVEEKAGMAETRKNESIAADTIMEIDNHIFLDNPCQDLQNNLSNYHEIIKIIRKYTPVRIYTQKSPSMHRDHRNAHDLVTEAWWKACENVLVDYGKPYRAAELFVFEVTNLIESPDLIVDITDEFKIKMEALLAFKSQFNVLSGIDNYIKGLSLVRGYQAGCLYGEAFDRSNFMPTIVR